MQLSRFIANRIRTTVDGTEVSRPAVRVAMAGMAIGIAVMIVTIFVAVGFKSEVREKVIGFAGDIEVTNFENNNTYEMRPITVSDTLISKLQTLDGIRLVEPFATKPGMIKTDSAFETIVFKGVDSTYDWTFYSKNMVDAQDGLFVDKTLDNKQVIISEQIAKRLNLWVDSAVYCYFIQDKIRVRKFTVAGVYSTDLEDYDRLFVIGGLDVVQQLNEWNVNQVSGLEIYVSDYSRLAQTADDVYFATANRFDSDGEALYTRTIREINPQIFSWLALLDTNVWVIIMLMLSVAGFNIISGLIILILDGIRLIGILRALGATVWEVRKVFLWQAAYLIGRGMIYGNLVGLALCVVQYFTHLVPLDPSTYYVSYVPITFDWLMWIVLNAGTLIFSLLILVGPSHIVARISPAQTMRYE